MLPLDIQKIVRRCRRAKKVQPSDRDTVLKYLLSLKEEQLISRAHEIYKGCIYLMIELGNSSPELCLRIMNRACDDISASLDARKIKRKKV